MKNFKETLQSNHRVLYLDLVRQSIHKLPSCIKHKYYSAKIDHFLNNILSQPIHQLYHNI